MVADKWNHVDKAFMFFSEKHKTKSKFKLSELAKYTDWSIPTVSINSELMGSPIRKFRSSRQLCFLDLFIQKPSVFYYLNSI